jgi:short-subunit dehydrogenase
MLELMVGAVLELSHAAAGQMAGRSAGAILNVSSVAAYLPAGPYSAAKSWVSNFSHGLALELAPAGVRVLVLCPGYVHTEFHARARINTGSIPSWSWLEAPAVVRRALLDLRRGRTISIPSVRYRTLCWFLRHAPAPVLRRVVAVRDTQRREQEPSALG